MKAAIPKILNSLLFVVLPLCAIVSFTGRQSETIDTQSDMLRIKKTADFPLSGDGSHANWEKTEWLTLPPYDASAVYATRVKALYSATGMYFLYFCEDKKLTATMEADFLDLWNEDVIEVFIQPDAKRPAYFEYELSPLNYELPILIYNDSGRLNSWQPFHYNKDQKTRHATLVQGGEKKARASVKSWTAEFFIPFKAMKMITDEIPQAGTRWKGNLYRIDYDSGNESLYSWKRTSGNFHEYEKFGTFIFE